MMRLKDGFYSIMKISNAVLAKPENKNDIIEFSKNNKIEKPITEIFLQPSTTI
jgi:hypothetical protein